MGRQVRRVPLDSDWPIDKVWRGFLMPESLHEATCQDCDGSGYSPEASRLQDRWYGNYPFHPSETGSPVLTASTPEVRAFAERNVSHSPQFYGTSESCIVAEAQRLADLFNASWCHHLAQPDIDALIEAGRLMDFTHTWTRGEGWQRRDPVPTVTAAQVNAWSLSGMAHDGINCWVVVKAACEREGIAYTCVSCNGHGYHEVYPGQRAESEAWEPTEPPTGDGWQLWETVSEGSPISPVFDAPEGLAGWMSSDAYHWGSSRPMQYDAALRFVTGDGWAPSLIFTPETGLIPGEQFEAGVS